MTQTLTKLWVHIIFSTKNRQPFLDNPQIRGEMFAYPAEVTRDMNSPSTIVGGMEDHVHILCLQHKNITLPDLVGKLKRTSSKWIKSKGREYADFYWHSGYGAFSVSQSAVPDVKNYIANQQEKHRDMSFQEEFRLYLKRHGVVFDERYVWE